MRIGVPKETAAGEHRVALVPEVISKLATKGLDVVAREVGAAGGQVRVESTSPQGTKIILHLPTTLRAELAIPVLCGKQRFAVPSRSVLSVIKLERVESTAEGDWIRIQKEGSVQLIRIYSLDALLGGDGSPKVGEAAVIVG